MGVSMLLALSPIVGAGVLVGREIKRFERHGGSAIAYLVRVSIYGAIGPVGALSIVALLVVDVRIFLMALAMAPPSVVGMGHCHICRLPRHPALRAE